MRLAEESRARLESFFRWYERDERLRLPAVFIHAGFWSDNLTRMLRAGAFTVGRHIFVSRKVIVRNAHGELTMPGWLLAHEAAHVRQFQRAGFLKFAFSYTREYLTLLVRGGKFDAGARMRAYEQIAPEMAARGVEAAYLEWRAGVPPSPVKSDC
jgi:hypothetical protein